MTFAAIVAQESLGIPRLLHAASMKAQGRLRTNTTSRSLADFVGADANSNWHVIEAKARQQKANSTDEARWRAQAQTVGSIDGQAPLSCSYCYTRVDQNYSIELVDPPPGRGDVSLSFPNGRRDIVEYYYGCWRDALREPQFKTGRNEYTFRLLLAAYDSVEREYIFAGIEDRTWEMAANGEMTESLNPFETEDCYMGADGIVVIISKANTP